MLCCAMLCYTILYCTILYYAILYYTILYYAILYYTILYYTILYYTTAVFCMCETWCHTLRKERVTRVLRKIFGPKRDDAQRGLEELT
jgi:hypothetical protein